MSLVSACLFLFFSVVTGASPPAPAMTSPTTASPSSAALLTAPAVVESLARIDALHHRRDERPAVVEERQLIDAAVVQAPRDYAVLWRAARLYFWLSDDPSLGGAERSKLGKAGWDLAERAIAIDANQAAGHYWAALNMGSYALGLGTLKALTMGMEGKFRDRLQRAGQLAPAYEFGGVEVAWGRFYEKLPWPKRDRKRAEEHLRRVLLEQNPDNLRAKVFLADTLANDGRAVEAKKLLDEVAAAKPGRYDAPEERRAKALAVGVLAKVVKLLN